MYFFDQTKLCFVGRDNEVCRYGIKYFFRLILNDTVDSVTHINTFFL